MEEHLITFETAKLAKKKGFPQTTMTEHFNDILPYREDGTRKLDLNYNGEEYSAVTQSLLQKWLREKYSMHLTINIGLPHNCSDIMYYSNVIKFGKHHKSKFRSVFYKTYEEALEDALQEALKLIK